ncbi:hypothetical protein KGA66_27400 [Actinocrinis puniceicyclus]|uniref:Uncharacterized protein n=1 Tax=Actinocrinis puniceicyclus TaxID=977794 RepID=A0A8J7WQU2_9ACTN|nr:hypothetical protein [Actinocrinis puniceicyclus]MBS2966793.1 hypothetical protein [Actinocrinis puniceicyclus]
MQEPDLGLGEQSVEGSGRAQGDGEPAGGGDVFAGFDRPFRSPGEGAGTFGGGFKRRPSIRHALAGAGPVLPTVCSALFGTVLLGTIPASRHDPAKLSSPHRTCAAVTLRAARDDAVTLPRHGM